MNHENEKLVFLFIYSQPLIDLFTIEAERGFLLIYHNNINSLYSNRLCYFYMSFNVFFFFFNLTWLSDHTQIFNPIRKILPSIFQFSKFYLSDLQPKIELWSNSHRYVVAATSNISDKNRTYYVGL